jgi:predicted MFS family arabinose efflux permease
MCDRYVVHWIRIASLGPCRIVRGVGHSAQISVLAASAAIYYMGVPIYGPAIPTMLLRCVPSHRRGAIMGLDGAINTIARVVSPLLMGELYRRYGAGAAFGCAGVAVFGGVATTLFRRYVVLKDMYADDTRRD